MNPAQPKTKPVPKPKPKPETEPVKPSVAITLPAKPDKKIFMLIGGLLGAVVLGVIAYLLVNALNTPARVREKVSLVQPVYKDYSRAMDKIGKDLLEESNDGFDADSLERAVNKSKSLVEDATANLETLESLIKQTNIKQVASYKTSVESYITTSKELLDLEEQTVQWGEELIEPWRQYEELTLEVSGISSYLYSDPDRYNSELEDAIEKENQIIEKIKNIELSGDLKDINDVLVERMEIETEFLQNQSDAVQERSTTKIAEASQEYVEKLQSSTKTYNRLSDKLDDRIEDLVDSLTDLNETVEQEYSSLRTAYKF